MYDDWAMEDNNVDVDVDDEPTVDEDDLWSIAKSNKSDEGINKKAYMQFNKETDSTKPVFFVGMLFGTAVDIKTAINEYAVRSRRQIKFAKNDKRGVTAKCVGNEYCAWKVK